MKKKFVRFPVGVTAFTHYSGNHHYITLRVNPGFKKHRYMADQKLIQKGSVTLHGTDYQQGYRQCLLWLGEDPEQAFPYTWDEFIDLFGLERKQITKEVLIKSYR